MEAQHRIYPDLIARENTRLTEPRHRTPINSQPCHRLEPSSHHNIQIQITFIIISHPYLNLAFAFAFFLVLFPSSKRVVSFPFQILPYPKLTRSHHTTAIASPKNRNPRKLPSPPLKFPLIPDLAPPLEHHLFAPSPLSLTRLTQNASIRVVLKL